MAELSEVLIGTTNYTNTDTKVTQTATSSNDNYEVLFSETADNTTRTEGAGKADNLTFNPSTGNLTTAKMTATKATNQLITGTGTAGEDKGSGQSPRYFPSTWKFNTGITVAAGDTFTIKIPVAGISYGVWISVDNGTNYYPVVTQGTTKLTTHFPVDNIITVVYEASATIDVMPTTGGDGYTSYTGGIFRVLNFYDSNTNTQMRLYRQNSGYNNDYPLLASRSLASAIGTAGSNGSYSAIYGVMWDDTTKIPTLNPSTGQIKAVKMTLTTAPSANMDVATKKYVDDSITSAITDALNASY